MRLRTLLLIVVLLVAVGGLAFRFWPHQSLAAGTRADAILVIKSERTLRLLKNGETIASYRVSLGKDPLGPKTQSGDGRTPEGQYSISRRKADSNFFRALEVSYPNDEDRQRARELGIKNPGNYIMVHGIKNGLGWLGRLHRLVDWTDGCMAVTNEEMLDIWNATAQGRIAIEIRP